MKDTSKKRTLCPVSESDALKICDDAIKTALEETRSKCQAKCIDDVVLGLKNCNECMHGYFRFFMVLNVLECVASKIDGLKSIYMFGSTVEDSSDIYSDINLILHVGKKDQRLERTMEGLNMSLTKSYNALLGLKSKPTFRLLDLHFVTDKEIATKKGAAALMGSVYNPPVLVWKFRKGVCKA